MNQHLPGKFAGNELWDPLGQWGENSKAVFMFYSLLIKRYEVLSVPETYEWVDVVSQGTK